MSGKPKVERKPKLRFEQEFPYYWANKKQFLDKYNVGGEVGIEGIKAGDLLTVKEVNSISDEELYVCEISANCFDDGKSQRCLRYIYDNFGDIVIHTDDTYGRYKSSEIKLLGVVIKVERDFKPPELWKKLAAEQPKSRKEITATCRHCQKTATGSKSFLSSLGWWFEKRGAECMACWRS